MTAPDHAALLAEIATLRLLLARNLVMDLGSAEEGADHLGGIWEVIEMVGEYRDQHQLPEFFGPDGEEIPF